MLVNVCPRLRKSGGVQSVLASGGVIQTHALIGSACFMVPPAAAIFVDVSYRRGLSGLSAVKAETAKVTSFQVIFALKRLCTMGFLHSVGEIMFVSFIFFLPDAKIGKLDLT